MTDSILNVCFNLQKRIDREKSKLRVMKDTAINITQEIDGLPKSKNQASRVDRLTAAIIDAENLINQLTEIKAECCIDLIDRLTAANIGCKARDVLFYRYGLCLPFTDIAARLGYHLRTVFRLHSEGLKIFS